MDLLGHSEIDLSTTIQGLPVGHSEWSRAAAESQWVHTSIYYSNAKVDRWETLAHLC